MEQNPTFSRHGGDDIDTQNTPTISHIQLNGLFVIYSVHSSHFR